MFRNFHLNSINKILLYLLLFFFIFFVIAARRPDILLYAQPWAEDGFGWLSGMYDYGWGSLIYPHNGYFQTISRLAYGIGLLFGLSKAALVANIISISIRCCFVMFVLSSRIQFIPIKYRVAAIIYFLLMPNFTEGYVNITNAQWYLSLYLFAIIFADDSDHLMWKIHDWVVGVIAGLSGPFIISLFICLFIKRCAQRKGRFDVLREIKIFDIIITFCFIIQILAILITINPSTRSYAPLGANFGLFVNIVSYRIIGGTFFPNYSIVNMSYENYWNLVLFCLFVVIACIMMLYFKWRFWISILFPAAVFSASLLKPMASMTLPQWQFFLLPGMCERYFFIPNFTFFCFILLIISCLGRFSSVLLYGLMICVIPIFLSNFFIPPLVHVGYKEDIAKFESISKGQEMFIRINPPGWFMILKKK